MKNIAPLLCTLQRIPTVNLGTNMFPTFTFIKKKPAGRCQKMLIPVVKVVPQNQPDAIRYP